MQTRVLIAVGVIARGTNVLIGRRESGADLAGYWEFPGGKVEPGESFEVAVRREVEEETGLVVDVGEELDRVNFEYDHAAVHIRFFQCALQSNPESTTLNPRFQWVRTVALGEYEFPPANRTLITALLKNAIE